VVLTVGLVVRLAPPLVVSRAQIDEAVAALARVLFALGQEVCQEVSEALPA